MMKPIKATTQEYFNEKILTAIQSYFGSQFQVSVNRVTRNNDTVLFGLSILKQNSSCAPTIYLNQYYDRYLDGRLIPEIVIEIISIYEKNKLPQIDIQEVCDLTCFDRVKDKIIFKLINLDRNKEFLADVPYIVFNDLAVVFSVIIN